MYQKLLVVWLLLVLLSGCSQSVSLPEHLTARDWQGNTVQLDDFKGHWLVVNYWALWCHPCREELPALAEFYKQHQDEVTVLGVGMDIRDSAKMAQVIADFKVTYPLLVDDPLASLNLDINYLPTTVIISPDGVIQSLEVKTQTLAALEAQTIGHVKSA